MITIPTKKLKNGFELPVYGLGLWGMGGRREVDDSKDTVEVEAIRAAVDAGVTHIDTAEVYGVGHAEELLGKAIEDYDRSKLILASKVTGANQSYDNVMRSCEGSLKRIGTDYLDLYMLHSFPNPGIDITDTMRAMDELIRQGMIKNIGLSNVTQRRFNVAQSLTENKIVCNQVHYNVQYREVEQRGLLKYAQGNDVMLVAWRPLQKGALPNAPIIAELAEKYNKTPSQIAINWLISQQNVVTIAKTSSVDHLIENLGAIDWVMENEDIERIREDFPNQQFVSDAVPLDYPSDTPPNY
ncbi:MAG: Aldo/keto reductase [Candidatus Saccharibacteria bacterium]|nr:Aldo/keto reductase [Candidatus Saccharibacteria bacterium]